MRTFEAIAATLSRLACDTAFGASAATTSISSAPDLAVRHPLGKLDYQHSTRQLAEVLVDTVTYVVCGQVGLDVEGESIPGVAGWGETGALEAVHTFAATVDAVPGAIEAAIAPARDRR